MKNIASCPLNAKCHFPLLVFAVDDGSLMVYHSVAELNRGAIEAEDVVEKLYRAFDCRGTAFHLCTDLHREQYRILWLPFLRYTTWRGSKRIFLGQSGKTPRQEHNLLSFLRRYLGRYHQLDLAETTPLQELVERALHVIKTCPNASCNN